MAVSVGSYVKHGLLLACILYGQINAQSTDKFNAMALAGSAAKSPETLQVPSWKYSRIANAAPEVGLASPSAGIAEDTDGDDEAESDDVFPGAPGVSATNYNVSDLCMNHTLMYLEALADNQAWAISMLDSAGKLPSGILLGNLVWRGAYSECLNVSAVIYSNVTAKSDPSYPFRGRYCQVTAVPGGNPNATTPPAQGINALFVGGKPSITIGLCLPDSCNGEDVVGLINAGLSLLPANLSSTPIYGKCPEVQELSTDARAITVIVLASLILAVVILGTGYDVIRYQIPAYIATLPTGDDVLINQYPHQSNGMVDSDKHSEKTPLLNGGEGVPSQPEHQGKLERALLAFSIYSNGKKMLSTKQGQGTLGAVHGVRFLSMTWVMLGHTYVFGLGAGENLGSFVAVMYKRFSFQAISNATVSVDSFFLLSGLLVAYLTLKEMHKGGGRLNWGLFYFHRFWRLTPPYMLLMMVYVPLFKYLASGPLWPEDGVELNYCKDSWWTNLLYINNLVRVKEMCMGWSWYLANDMQFFVISPLILIPLYYSLVAGGAIILVLLIGSSLATGLLSVHFNAGAGLTGGGPAMDYFLYIYIRPYCRIGPYLIGLFFGYALYRTKCKARLNWIVVLVGWICAAVCCLSVLYGLYDVETHTNKVLSIEVSALYNALSRTAWSIGLGWLIFACCSGYGGFVNTILSWNALIPLSRLTYCAYLVHPIVMYVYYYSLESALNFTDLTVIYLFLGHLVMSYMAAFVISLVFESPMMGLERVFLSRDKRS